MAGRQLHRSLISKEFIRNRSDAYRICAEDKADLAENVVIILQVQWLMFVLAFSVNASEISLQLFHGKGEGIGRGRRMTVAETGQRNK
jgi:hypothetical protein